MASNRRSSGFTLLEVVVTLALIAILGSTMYVFFNNALTRGHIPLKRMALTGELHTVMENITARYDTLKSETPATALQNELGGMSTPHRLPSVFCSGTQSEFTVSINKFISFGAGNAETNKPTDRMDILKVTIQNSQGESLTSLFSD